MNTQQTPSNSAQSPKFIDLPLEVLTEILTLVEWTDVLCARQVSLSIDTPFLVLMTTH